MSLSKMLRSASARPNWLDCQRSAVLLPHFLSVLTAKDLKFRFHTSALPWPQNIWSSASALLLCLDCQRSEVPLPLCLYCQRSEVPRPHFRSALTAKNVKFRFRTSALSCVSNMWSSAFALPLCLDWQRFEISLSALVLPGLPKMWVPLPHFISSWTSKDLQFRFCTFAQSWLPKSWRSASPLTLCLHCHRTSLLPWLQKICSFTFQICLHSQRCERTSALPWLPKFCRLSSAVGSYYVFPHNFVLSYMKD